MPQRACFVPGCESEYRQKNEGNARSFFNAPNVELLEKWKKTVPNGHELTMKDVICDVHFLEEDVSRYYEHKIKDGSIFKVKRGFPCLAENAVPIYFSDLPEYANKTKSPSRSPSPGNCRGIKMCLSSDENFTSESSSPNKNLNPMLSDSSFSLEEARSTFNFAFITKHHHLVKKPSSNWSFSFISEGSTYMLCVKWRAYQPERRVIIDDSLNAKVFFRDRKLEFLDTFQITSLDDIAYLIQKVNDYVLCNGVDGNGSDDCTVILKESYKYPGKKKWCYNCSTERKRLLSASTRRKAKEKFEFL